MNDIIQGNKFKALTKIHYAPTIIKPCYLVPNNFSVNDYRYLRNTLDLRQLQDGDIIYTHTFWTDQLFDLIKNINKKFTVITHNCDTNICFSPPDNVIKWFSQNVNIIHERVFSIPIGLENDIWYPEKKEKMRKKLTHPRTFKNMIYVNHNIKTNPAKREKPYQVLGGKPWATSRIGANGEGFDNYLDNIYNHPFVVCPEGNGIDTHRTWECLYLGTIPVMERNINNSFYTDLPILFIDDWEEITEKFLCDEYIRIMDLLKDGKWNMDKLKFNYWKNLISQ